MANILLLINSISGNPGKDELDVLVQAEAIEKSLAGLGHSSQREFFSLDLKAISTLLRTTSPDLVFNLVETVEGEGSLIHLAPSLLEAYDIPFTGSGAYAMLTTTDKLRTKEILDLHGIPTPGLLRAGGASPDPDKIYILKPVNEDGSAGISDLSLLEGKMIDMERLSREGILKKDFLEEYIDGREFNISLLAGENGPEVLPVAEMLYVNYEEGKPKILNYASKWDESSFEYHNTVRTFDLPPSDQKLVTELREISLRCWEVFGLDGYARVDFRVDKNSRPYVLEVNANPCISPDAGFSAACARAGISYTEMIKRIIKAVP